MIAGRRSRDCRAERLIPRELERLAVGVTREGAVEGDRRPGCDDGDAPGVRHRRNVEDLRSDAGGGARGQPGGQPVDVAETVAWLASPASGGVNGNVRFEQVGGFDEDFFMYGEDLDICFRVKLLGKRNFYHPGTTVIHFKGESAKSRPFRSFLYFYHAMVIFSKKHFELRALPAFLEGPVHAMRLGKDLARAHDLYERVKASPLYDRKLRMYKTNAALEGCSHEIGRLRAARGHLLYALMVTDILAKSTKMLVAGDAAPVLVLAAPILTAVGFACC